RLNESAASSGNSQDCQEDKCAGRSASQAAAQPNAPTTQTAAGARSDRKIPENAITSKGDTQKTARSVALSTPCRAATTQDTGMANMSSERATWNAGWSVRQREPGSRQPHTSSIRPTCTA